MQICSIYLFQRKEQHHDTLIGILAAVLSFDRIFRNESGKKSKSMAVKAYEADSLVSNRFFVYNKEEKTGKTGR